MVIAVLDDHPMIRTGLSMILAPVYRQAVIKGFEKISDIVEFCKNQVVDIAIVDLHLKNESGFEFLSYCQENNKDVKSIILTSSIDYQDYEKALNLGAQGYLLKESLPEDIIYAVKLALRERKYVDPYFVEHKNADTKQFEMLTDREFEVFELIGKGYSNTEIGERLFISKNTVKKHVTQVLSKLEVNDRIHIVLLAQDHFHKH